MRVLVTGVTGFLGGRIAESFRQRGLAVTGLVRRTAGWTRRPEGAAVVEADITDPDAVREAVAGHDAVVHAAALVKLWVPDVGEFERVNVGGLRNVLDAAVDAGVRVVWCSSFFALGPSDGEVLAEDSPRRRHEFCTEYERTKYLADQIARGCDPSRVDLVRMYPGILYGPGELTEGNYLVRMLAQHARGKLPGLLGRTDLWQCYAFVDDVVEGFARALESAPAGSGYILGGENATVEDLFELFRAETGIRPPRLRIPYTLASWVGRAQRWRAEWTGRAPELTEHAVEVYRHEWAYSSDRAVRELDYRITPLAEGMRRTVAWMRDAGLIGAGPERGSTGV